MQQFSIYIHKYTELEPFDRILRNIIVVILIWSDNKSIYFMQTISVLYNSWFNGINLKYNFFEFLSNKILYII